ncbi:MAG: hypothetical protein ACRCWC_03720 [Plesiomonas shigelloides]
MATSGTTAYNPNRDAVIRRALRLVGAYQANSQPRPEQISDAQEVLNMMLKAWQIDGLVWLREFVTISLVAGQVSYLIGPNSTDTVVDEDGNPYIQRPFRVTSATRKTGTTETTLTLLTRDEYSALSNKTTQSTVVNIYFDAQLTDGRLYVWPVSGNSTDQIVLTAERGIEDMVADTNTFDLPVEWMEAISYGLAYRICPEYGITGGERDQLGKEAAASKENIISSCREFVPVVFAGG